ncbi:MAG TPA: hypothetical protein VKA60_13730 [Blastocatellia bacterium]|nr:hypothetical protein [Blastocatellia bacterium]
MRCEEFERVVTDLACEFLIEAAQRKRALAHARACARCAARLRQERALSAALNVAANAETAQAPAGMKTALLAAFQQQAAPAPVTRWPAPSKQAPRRVPRWMMAAAAALMLLAILVALQVLHKQSAVESSANSQTPIAQSPNSTSVTDKQDVQKKVQAAVQNDKTTKAPRAARRPMRPVFRPEMASRNRSSTETVTEFIPLTTLADATAMHSGTVLRVEVPRASLIAMGLPLNAERAHETVKADIVVGDDGLARAIRLVY